MESIDVTIQNENEPKQLDIAKFTIKSLFWVVVVGILLAASFLNFFNYPALKFYTSLNIKTRALESAESYLKGNNNVNNDVLPLANSKYADALLCAVNNSISLMNSQSAVDYNSKKTKKYAQKTELYTDLYLAYDTVGSMGDRSKAINDYNLLHSKPENHPSLVSFSDFLAVKQAKARFILGKDSLVNDECLKITNLWEDTNWQISQDNKAFNDYFVMFDKLNQFLARELNQIGFSKLAKASNGAVDYQNVKDNIKINTNNFNLFVTENGEFTRLYNIINLRFDDFKEFLKLNATQDTVFKQLYVTYYLKIMTEFAQNMEYFSMVVSANEGIYKSEFKENLQNLHTKVWIPHSLVSSVKIYEKGKPIVKDTNMQKWYSSGALIDYILLYSR